MTSSTVGCLPQYVGLRTSLTYSSFLNSTVWNGPDPTIGTGLRKVLLSSSTLSLPQMCSGRT